ncbi:MAG: fructose-1,6-bisphosphatase [Candidatus Methanomethylophilaceae archaeon]|nr:fructose-1,6-bisphosphatase [Candidatus Methanomethylophilaceae archaeon]MDD3378483.1 fructose-1,6-bisphosphatase [Candidatus Methanomethylophilaceae archaeon]MDY0223844.1 fructose-1,6-bisphosphatase [Candidatus Methanomethylophilaceae archaeon]
MAEEKVTVSIIKADVGSVVGHSRPHPAMLQTAKDILADKQKQGIIEDFYVTRVGDDINLYMTHYKGEGNKEVHSAAWECFQSATKIAKSMKLYAAGQDILTDAFSGNVKGAGPGSAEMSFVERESEPLLFFMADKTEPSAYTLPLSRIFLDPFTTTGLVIDAKAKKGFDIEIHDVMDHKKVTMSSPEETLSILTLLGDTSRYAIKRISSRAGIGPACVVSTDKLNLTAGKYIGKDDPVCICRCQSGLPSVGEYTQPFLNTTFLVAGWMRGSHIGALYPCSPDDSDPTYFDGPPRICCLGFQLNEGKLQGVEPIGSKGGNHVPMDFFGGRTFDLARENSIKASKFMRSQGPFVPSILSAEEMEYTSRTGVLKELTSRFEQID